VHKEREKFSILKQGLLIENTKAMSRERIELLERIGFEWVEPPASEDK